MSDKARAEAEWGKFRDGPDYAPTDRYDVRAVWDAAWSAALSSIDRDALANVINRGSAIAFMNGARGSDALALGSADAVLAFLRGEGKNDE